MRRCEISDKTRKLVHALYISREALEVCEILENECSAEALSCSGFSPVQMERIHFAVLKLAKEDVMDFDSAVNQAQTDWRDLLVFAGFGDNVLAHEQWAKRGQNQPK